MAKSRQSKVSKSIKIGEKINISKGGNGYVLGASEGVLSGKSVLPSSDFLSTGTGGRTSTYETAVMPSPSSYRGGKRRGNSKKNRKTKRSKTTKKWFGWF